jgi:hypothetical protein
MLRDDGGPTTAQHNRGTASAMGSGGRLPEPDAEEATI